MDRLFGTIGLRSAARIGALIVSLAVVPAAFAQQAPQPPAQASPQATPQAASRTGETRGLFDAIGRWWDEGTAGFRSHVQGANRSFEDLNQRAATTSKNLGDTAVGVGKGAVDAGIAAADVTRDTMGSVAKLPMSRVVNGRERCELAPNGAPDCLKAAETLCRKNGYSGGKSMDFTSAEQCPARSWLAGRQTEAECTTVTFISRAMCQ